MKRFFFLRAATIMFAATLQRFPETVLSEHIQRMIPSFPPHLVGNVSAVYALVDRVVGPGSSTHFTFELTTNSTTCPGIEPGINCFTLADHVDYDDDDDTHTKMRITGTTASEVTAGLGYYLREYCNMTIGWNRGGGTYVRIPNKWPRIGSSTIISKSRSVPWSHVTQVCTHSYTLVWHDWAEWEQFIDWMALSGHNSIVAPTGQEEIQYQILTHPKYNFGLSDIAVRNWTNGPAWLTWSRGQNSHGSGIGGPLPRSFMKSQFTLQKLILKRYRELGIVGHLPAFGGYAPWALAVQQNATHRIAQGKGAANDTAWIDGRDPLYTKVADAWIAQIISDFGSDHVWQMDAFFANGSTWGRNIGNEKHHFSSSQNVEMSENVSCVWSDPIKNTYLKGDLPVGHVAFPTLTEAKTACLNSTLVLACGGIVSRNNGTGPFELRAGIDPIPVPVEAGESTYIVTNLIDCVTFPPDPIWHNRSKAAYGAVVRADGPTARWVYQGYALNIDGTGTLGPKLTPRSLARLRGFTEPIPEGQFILLDMSAHGEGQWKSWEGKWKLPFIWTALHDYGGSIGIKGNLSKVNEIPFRAPPLVPVPPGYDPKTHAVGVGYTPEGLDQNPVYYELLQEAAFKQTPEPDITSWLIKRAHRRYGLLGQDRYNLNVSNAWVALGASGYARDLSVGDSSGVGQMGLPDEIRVGTDDWTSLYIPSETLCLQWKAWMLLNSAAPAIKSAAETEGRVVPEPFVYDLVNTGRQILSELSAPLLLNFSSSLQSNGPTARRRMKETGNLFIELLQDLDRLLATDAAFMLGPWLEGARRIGGDGTDCIDTQVGNFERCADFMEWNARSQLTTWYPTLDPNNSYPGQQGGRDHDYARKQWSGLIRDYYVPRVEIYLKQALDDESAGVPFNNDAVMKACARLSFRWQNDYGPNEYPIDHVESPLRISTLMLERWSKYFSSCKEFSSLTSSLAS